MGAEIADQLPPIPMSPALGQTLARAAQYAHEQSHAQVTLEHLLLSLTEDDDAQQVLLSSGVDIPALQTDVSQHVGRIDDRLPQGAAGTANISDELHRILNAAAVAARAGRRSLIDGAIVLAAVIGDGRTSAAGLLKSHGLTFDVAINAIRQSAKPQGGTPPPQPPPAGDRGSPVAAGGQGSSEDILATARAKVASRKAAGYSDRLTDPQSPHAAGSAGHAASEAPFDDRPSSLEEGEGLDSLTGEDDALEEEAQHSGPAEERADQDVGDEAEPAAAAPVPQPPILQPQVKRPAPPAQPEPALQKPIPPPPPPPAGWAPPPSGQRPPAAPPRGAPPPLPTPAPARPPAPAPGASQHSRNQAGGYPGPSPAPPREPPWTGPAAGARGGLAPTPPRSDGYAQPQRHPEPSQRLERAPLPSASQSARPSQAPARQRQESPAILPGQLVENVPRKMRVGITSPVEVRIAKAEVKAISAGLDAAATYHHDIQVTKAMSVRLRSPEGGFYIETASPETQWIENALGLMADDFARWRWTVTPKVAGRRKLQLVVSARTVGPDGLAAETSLPAQVIEIRVSTNYGVVARRIAGWTAAAILGGLLAQFGAQGWTVLEPMLEPLLNSLMKQ